MESTYNNVEGVNDFINGIKATHLMASAFRPVHRVQLSPTNDDSRIKKLPNNEIKRPIPVHGISFADISPRTNTISPRDAPMYRDDKTPNDRAFSTYENHTFYATIDLLRLGCVYKVKSIIEDVSNSMFVTCQPLLQRRGKTTELKEEEIRYTGGSVYTNTQAEFVTSRPLAWACALEDYILSNGTITYEWKYKLDSDDYDNRLYSECLIDVTFQEGKTISIRIMLRSGMVSIKGSHCKEWCNDTFSTMKENVAIMEKEINTITASTNKPGNDNNTQHRSVVNKSPEIELLWQQNFALRKALRHLENGLQILQQQLEYSNKENKKLKERLATSENQWNDKFNAFVVSLHGHVETLIENKLAPVRKDVNDVREVLSKNERLYNLVFSGECGGGFRKIEDTGDMLCKKQSPGEEKTLNNRVQMGLTSCGDKFLTEVGLFIKMLDTYNQKLNNNINLSERNHHSYLVPHNLRDIYNVGEQIVKKGPDILNKILQRNDGTEAFESTMKAEKKKEAEAKTQPKDDEDVSGERDYCSKHDVRTSQNPTSWYKSKLMVFIQPRNSNLNLEPRR